MIDKYRLDDLRLESGEKGELARWVIQLQTELDRERRKSGNAPVIPGWTPVSECMPMNGDRVLVFIDFDSSSVPPLAKDAEYTGTTFRIGPNTVNTTGVPHVTHWMKLPPAPKQENI